MRFNYKAIEYPKIGDTRYIKKFAYFPIVIGNKKIWFESYYSLQIVRMIRSSVLGIFREHSFIEDTKCLLEDLDKYKVDNKWNNYSNSWFIDWMYDES